MEKQDTNSLLNSKLLQIIEESEVPQMMKPYLHEAISRMEKNLPSLTDPFERLNFLHFYVSSKMNENQLLQLNEATNSIQGQFDELILRYKKQSEFV